MITAKKLSLLGYFTLSLLLSACSGSGGSSKGSNTQPEPDKEQPKTQISLSANSVEFALTGLTQTLNITTTENWSITGAEQWLHLSKTQGSGNAEIKLTALVNMQTASRSANLQVSAGNNTANLAVTQQGFEYIKTPDSTGIRDISSTEFTELMGVGFNIGNSLDAVGGETAWGNPEINTQLIDAIKQAGFKSIRLPVAWSQFSDPENFIIKTEWLARVDEVVSYAIAQDLYVMLNIHWDGGWMQPVSDEQDSVNNRLAIMWTQIAEYFEKYDDKLLFAGTNEVMVEGDYSTPSAEYTQVQNSFNQTFIAAVRATGGKNAYRQLIVQGFNTNIDHTVNFVQIPDDVIAERLMMEVHFYDPYEFALDASSDKTQWGENAVDASKTVGWANESYIDAQFLKMQTHFYDQGIGLILGEYGAIARTNIEAHHVYRLAWHDYVTQSAFNHHLVPFYWDNGDTGQNGFALFNRASGEALLPDLINAIIENDEK
ncbi:cellulase family glycosylhydrolase [Catenovulum sp. 2E275]|uniref:cellulase family glycosylhydrolase n=1 Tax=Catenovulum sp. 2E275 TaxID=2980497 RepID=UPI0021D15C39|nr:cellulase family glycosylhydrolase [Catenovulum sp. 2E275]MCU4677247.1 cellulase family glycosylhydrolase [Catenovulum sp. 2E275]